MEPDSFGNLWQYHSRSDHHSKVTCWAILFDLLNECAVFRNHVEAGCVGFGINHPLMDFQRNRPKKLDLVVCVPGTAVPRPSKLQRMTFRELGRHFGVVLNPKENDTLRSLPDIPQVTVGSVLIALEAKACMTEHVKAISRLHDELTSSFQAIQGSNASAVAAGLAMVNASDTFVSPGMNKHRITPQTTMSVNFHRQPDCSLRVISDCILKVARRSKTVESGFDALGMIVVDAKNDGSPVGLVTSGELVPLPNTILDYEYTIRKICSEYGNRHSNVC